MRTLLLTSAALLFAASTATNAADIYTPAPGYGAAPPPPPAYYGAGPPPVQAVPGFVEAPPPAYAPLPPPVAYPLPPRVAYGAPGYGPQPGWVYSGPPVAYDEVEPLPPARVYRGVPVYAERPPYRCWWEWGHRHCAPRHGW